MDPLSALMSSYGDDDDDDDDDEEEEETVAPAAAALAPKPAPAAAPAALPDAGDLLGDLPDEVDWSVRAPSEALEAAPAHDAVGTRYNAVPLPNAMARAGDTHNQRALAGKARQPSKPGSQGLLGGRGGGGGSGGGGGGSSSAAKPSGGAGKSMLPPQLRRPNVATEDSAAWRTAKRHKTNE
tara:strand:+ start:264 stop:809 length:546 start_codon:yes stop_codon:yes gene_type:complete